MQMTQIRKERSLLGIKKETVIDLVVRVKSLADHLSTHEVINVLKGSLLGWWGRDIRKFTVYTGNKILKNALSTILHLILHECYHIRLLFQ